MRENGTIEHSGAFLKDAQVNSVLSRKQKKKGKIPTQKKGSVEEWVIAEEKKSLKRKKNLANARAEKRQGEMKNENNTRGIGEYNRKVA
jgi:hypothetical protein